MLGFLKDCISFRFKKIRTGLLSGFLIYKFIKSYNKSQLILRKMFTNCYSKVRHDIHISYKTQACIWNLTFCGIQRVLTIWEWVAKNKQNSSLSEWTITSSDFLFFFCVGKWCIFHLKLKSLHFNSPSRQWSWKDHIHFREGASSREHNSFEI